MEGGQLHNGAVFNATQVYKDGKFYVYFTTHTKTINTFFPNASLI